MTAIPDSSRRRRPLVPPAVPLWILIGLTSVGVAASGVLRFFIGSGKPLWLDETWTGAVVNQSSFRAFAEQVYLDANAPLYYLIEYGWTRVFGLSNAAMRTPGAIFGGLAPLVILFAPVALPTRTRWTWAGLTALWALGVWYSGDARCYTLLLLFCTLQALGFIRLLQAPSTARAAVWAAVSSLAVLTHYYAALITLVQGLAYLAYARRAALRTWPAAFAFFPAACWMGFHLPRLAIFSRPDVAWYPLLRPSRLLTVLTFVPGTKETAYGLAAIPILTLAAWAIWRRPPAADPRPGAAPWLAVGSAVLAGAILVLTGMLRPSFVDRYLSPSMPGVMLGVALIATWLGRRWAFAPAATVLVVGIALVPWAQKQIKTGFRFYNWEIASADLMRGNPERLVFLWDHPATPYFTRAQLDSAGGFFFSRAGRPVEVRSVSPVAGRDSNLAILKEAAPPRTAVIWAYDIGVRGTSARTYPPRLQALDASFTCRNYSRGSVGVVACDRYGSVEPQTR